MKMKMLIPDDDDHDEDGQDEDDACMMMIDTLAYIPINRIVWQRIIE